MKTDRTDERWATTDKPATISISVSREFKAQFAERAKEMGLKPSQLGRMLLFAGIERLALDNSPRNA